MHDEVEADAELVMLCALPDRVEIGVPEALPARSEGGDEDAAHVRRGEGLELLHGGRRVAERHVPEGEQAIAVAARGLERPAVVGAAVRRSESRVLDEPLPDQTQGGEDVLLVEAFGVEEADALVHVLETAVEHVVRIDLSEPAPFILFLAVARCDAKELEGGKALGAGDQGAVDLDVDFPTLDVTREADAALAVRGLHVVEPQIEGFHEVAVAIDRECHSDASSFVWSVPRRRSAGVIGSRA